eukprot:gnl/TRDRNA2_/TRDRNA2_93663_c0_seq1.p1 gnl/TRDRNA2_/TRDRNA2_93663_c0~~gnl/TRDRNA2_/TRDRNA2_93663_c0_seq1.p1  ORF type:complete len:235 (-),score=16.63 gnl/TRDRNA2_/TRDRNA2_93663_c0_seq1:403-1107(-)
MASLQSPPSLWCSAFRSSASQVALLPSTSPFQWLRLPVAFLALLMVIPNVAAFGYSMRTGLAFIDWFYPWPQNHRPFLAMPYRIRSHVFLNGAALLLGTWLLLMGSGVYESEEEIDMWGPLPLSRIYVALATSGSLAAVLFSFGNVGHNRNVKAGFVGMALGTVVPAWCGHFAASFAALFGAGVLFRIMALALPRFLPSKRVAQMVAIWGSWSVPLACVEFYGHMQAQCLQHVA